MKRLLDRIRLRRSIHQELDAYLEEKVADLTESGVPEAEARLRARREFGNASRVLRETILLAVSGIAIGIPVVVWLTKLTKSFLFGLEPNDPTVLAAAVLSLLAVCALAGWLPARRAARIDPTMALRCE